MFIDKVVGLPITGVGLMGFEQLATHTTVDTLG
jgi:hypothetical protein